MYKKNEKVFFQGTFFDLSLVDFINLNDALVKLADNIKWGKIENKLQDLYKKDFGRPAKPIRLVLGLLIIKYLYNLSDENAIERLYRDPYVQYFCGNCFFSKTEQLDPATLVRFRKRIKQNHLEDLLSETIQTALNIGMIREQEKNIVYADTTAQEKNVEFPTDAKLYYKMIMKINKMCKKYNIKLQRTYKTLAKKYLRDSNKKNQKDVKEEAIATLKTMLLNILMCFENESYLFPEAVKNEFSVLIKIGKKIYNQDKSTKNKIYSIHEPETYCIAKGKAHKLFEFGNKVAIATTKNRSLILGAVSFEQNIHDGKTLQPTLDSVVKITGKEPVIAIVDNGYQGHNYSGNCIVIMSKQIHDNIDVPKKVIKSRAKIEAVFSHLKNHYRLGKNFLKGVLGNAKNLFFSCIAYNFNKILLFIKRSINLKI